MIMYSLQLGICVANTMRLKTMRVAVLIIIWQRRMGNMESSTVKETK